MLKYVKPALMTLVILGLLLAFGLLIAQGIAGLRSPEVTEKGFGIGLIVLALVGAWSIWVLVRNGFELQNISARARAEGFELDTSGLERRPSGRIMPDSADKLFADVSKEYEANPEDWRVQYRLARAYDHAGDRARGREFMKKAVAGEAAERKASRG